MEQEYLGGIKCESFFFLISQLGWGSLKVMDMVRIFRILLVMFLAEQRTFLMVGDGRYLCLHMSVMGERVTFRGVRYLYEKNTTGQMSKQKQNFTSEKTILGNGDECYCCGCRWM